MTGIFNNLINEIAKSENISDTKLNVLKFALEIAAKIEEKEGVYHNFKIDESDNEFTLTLAVYYHIEIEDYCYESFYVQISTGNSNYPKKMRFFKAKSAEDIWTPFYCYKDEETEVEISWDTYAAITKAVNYLNKCPSNSSYEALTDEEIIAELKKFKYGENELTPLQFAYLYLLPNIVSETLQHSKSVKNFVYKDGYDEESYLKILGEFLNYLNSLLEYGTSYSFNKTNYDYFSPYIGIDEISTASIAKFLELFIPYYERISRAVISAGEKYVNEIDSMSMYDDDDDYSKPDWLGGMETEDEFWEHE